jgi:hypothetical protein
MTAMASLLPKVRVGFFSFTEITDPDAHHAYNEWHQLDHMPEQIPIPGVVSGERWVLTPACRRLARMAEPLSAVHYVTLYLMGEPLEETLAEFARLAVELRDKGRFFEARRAPLTGPFTVQERRAAPRVLISAEAVPHRPDRGVYVVVDDGNGAPILDVDDVVGTPGVAGVWTFAAMERPQRGGSMPAGSAPQRTGAQRVTVCYLDEDPLEVAATLAPDPDRAGAAEVLFAAPLLAVVPWEWEWFDGS